MGCKEEQRAESDGWSGESSVADEEKYLSTYVPIVELYTYVHVMGHGQLRGRQRLGVVINLTS